VSWFGYKLHFIVDAIYELPRGYKLTKASVPNHPQLLPLVEELDEKHHKIFETLAADRASTARRTTAGFTATTESCH